MSKSKNKIQNYDPNGVGIKGTLFGLPFDTESARAVIVPVPWEVTVSYGGGCANAPQKILDASPQLDIYDPDFPIAWVEGIAIDEISEEMRLNSARLREIAKYYIDWLELGSPKKYPNFVKNDFKIAVRDVPKYINQACKNLNEYVKTITFDLLLDGKLVGLLGGDHSTPLGFLQALGDIHTEFGILQIDAHADLRDSYEDFEFSHASVMFNALKIPVISRLVQVGIRDYCRAERDLIDSSNGRIITFFDKDIKEKLFEGVTWEKICKKIIKKLPQKVYISFDIDGLDPKLCPHTGTPVAGGFELSQIFYLLTLIYKSGRRIIGYDLNEVGDAEWDANVGARILCKLAALQISTNPKPSETSY